MNKNKKLLIKMIILLSLIIISLAVAYYNDLWPFSYNRPVEAPSVEKQVKIEEQAKMETQTDVQPETDQKMEQRSPESAEREKEKTNIDQIEGEKSQDKLTGVINYQQIIDQTLRVRITIDQELSSGVCRLTISKDDKSIVKRANVVANPSSSTCQGFDVSLSELESGQWQIEIVIESDEKMLTLKSSQEVKQHEKENEKQVVAKNATADSSAVILNSGLGRGRQNGQSG